MQSGMGLVCVVLLSLAGEAAGEEHFSGMSYLDNGDIRIGVDLELGGAITYLSESGSTENVVNSHDWGRQIQMSFYSGPVPFEPDGKKPHPSWAFLGWNPIQSGDAYDNRSRVIAHENDGTEVYVKSIPMQWPLDNEPGECTFESWITLEGNTARVRSRLNNARSDTEQYAGRGQELPAVYTNGAYYRLFTYTGDAPFTGGPLHQVTKVWDTRLGTQVAGGPWDDWYATENWAALVREDDWGLGIWSPGTYTFKGGFAGTPGAGGPKDGPTGYIAPIRREILDHNIEYSYDYVLILGSLEEIRAHVHAHAEHAPLPDYDFARDRQSWILRGATDAGWPLEGSWRVELSEEEQAALLGHKTLWEAERLPRLYLRAAFDTGETEARLRWERFGMEGAERFGEVEFAVIPDGEMRTYEIELAGAEGYEGLCTQLVLLPTREAGGGSVSLERLSPRRE